MVAVGDNKDGQCNISDWRDIVSVSAGNYHTVGLKSDGTVIVVGSNKYGQCDVSGWSDILIPSNRRREDHMDNKNVFGIIPAAVFLTPKLSA